MSLLYPPTPQESHLTHVLELIDGLTNDHGSPLSADARVRLWATLDLEKGATPHRFAWLAARSLFVRPARTLWAVVLDRCRDSVTHVDTPTAAQIIRALEVEVGQ